MSSVKSSAIVLKSIIWRDTSKIVTLFTRELGKINVIAKGARRSKSNYQGVLESINLLEVVIYVSSARKLQLLGQITLEDTFKNIRADYEKTVCAFALLELTDIFFKEGVEDAIYFDFLIIVLSEIGNISDPRIVFWYFLIKLSSYLGFKPIFSHCSICNRSIVAEEVDFSFREGSVICKNCSPSPGSDWHLSTTARKSLFHLQNLNHKKLSKVKIDLDKNFAFTDFLLAYLRYHSDEKLNLSSLQLIK